MCSVSNWKSLDKKRFCFKPGLQIWKMYFHSLFPFQGYIQRGNISIAIITWKIPHHEITLHYIRSQNFWTSSVSQCYCFPLKVMYDYLSSWLPQVRKKSGKNKFLQGKGKVREFHLSQGIFEKRQRKVRLFIWTLSPLSDERWWHFPFYDVYVTCVHCLVELTDSWPVYLYSSSCRFMNEMMFIFPFIFYSLFLFNFFDTINGHWKTL